MVPHNNLALKDKITEKGVLLQRLATQLSEGVFEYHVIGVYTGCYFIVQQTRPLMGRHQVTLHFYKQLYSYVDKFLYGNVS